MWAALPSFTSRLVVDHSPLVRELAGKPIGSSTDLEYQERGVGVTGFLMSGERARDGEHAHTPRATAIAGRLLGLDRKQLVNAFGVVLDATEGNGPGIWEGATTFKMNQGTTARNGVVAALLAKGGWYAGDDPLFGRGGFDAEVSRVGGTAQVRAIRQVAGKLRLDLMQYRELLTFAQFGTELDKTSQAQLDRGARGVDAFGHHAHRADNFLELPPLAQFHPNGAVTAQPACAGQHQIAHTGEASESFAAPAHRHRAKTASAPIPSTGYRAAPRRAPAPPPAALPGC